MSGTVEVRLPETVEEYQWALREAFVSGAVMVRHDAPQGDAMDEAIRRYPICRKTRRSLKLSYDLFVTTHRDGSLKFVTEHGNPYQGNFSMFSCDQTESIRDVLNRPFDEVDE